MDTGFLPYLIGLLSPWFIFYAGCQPGFWPCFSFQFVLLSYKSTPPHNFSYHLYSYFLTLFFFLRCVCIWSPFPKFICLLDSSISVSHFSTYRSFVTPKFDVSWFTWLRHCNQLKFPKPETWKACLTLPFLSPLISIQSPSSISFTSLVYFESILSISIVLVQYFMIYRMDFLQ